MLRLGIFLAGLLAAILVFTHPILHDKILHLGAIGYFGAFITGFFFVISFTVLPASAVLFTFADTLNPYLLALIGGLGAMTGDYVIYRFFRVETDGVSEKITNNHHHIKKLLKLRSIRWLAILVGAFIIVSPFPDELGIALLGITKLELKSFLLISFALNTVGIFILVSLGRIF